MGENNLYQLEIHFPEAGIATSNFKICNKDFEKPLSTRKKIRVHQQQ